MHYTLIVREIDWPGLTVQCPPTVRLSSTPTDSPNGPLDPDLDLQSLRSRKASARELPEDRSQRNPVVAARSKGPMFQVRG